MKPLPNSSTAPCAARRWAEVPGLEPDRLGDELKTMFHGMANAPLPEEMLKLALALDEAFVKGELQARDFSRLS